MSEEEKKEAQEMKDSLASMTPEQREEYEHLVKKNEEMDKERERYFEDDGLIADLIRANTKEMKDFSDFYFKHILDYEWKFAHNSRRFNMAMLGVIAIAVVYIAFNI